MRALLSTLLASMISQSLLCQNLEVFSPPYDRVMGYEYVNSFIKVNTIRNSYIRTDINSFEQYDANINYDSEEAPISFIDSIRVINGRLEIFHDNIFNITHADKSIKSYSPLYIGTFSGIVYKNKILEEAFYCANQIRTFRDTTYACVDGLYVYYGDSLIDLYNGDVISEFVYHGYNFGFIQDILVTNQNWFVLTSYGVLKKKKKTHEIDTLLSTSFQPHNCSRFTDDFYGWHSNFWFRVDTVFNTLEFLDTLGSAIRHVNEQKTLFTHEKGVCQNNYYRGRNNLIDGDFHAAHQFESIHILSSNSGLILFNTKDNTLDTVIQTEFNANSFSISGDTVILGSTNGLWKLNLNKLSELTELTENYSKRSEPWFSIMTAILCTGFYLILGLIFYTRLRQKQPFQSMYSSENIDIEEISNFIANNVTTVTINSIMTNFRISQNSLYKICEPLTPGELIRLKRIELVNQHKGNKSIKELSEISGFSMTYLKREVLPKLRH